MRPLVRQILIALVVSLCVIGAAVAWWIVSLPPDSLAQRIPADAVLAYVEAPIPDLSTLYPSLPPQPAPEPNTEALALVRMQDGTIGWLSLVRTETGLTRVHGSNPMLEPLLKDERPTLADDDVFKALMEASWGGWVYVADPRASPEIAEGMGAFLALDTPISTHTTDGGFDMRIPLRPSPRLSPVPARPLVALANPDHVLHVPSWNALTRMATSFTSETTTVAETLAATFLADIAPGVSLRYNASALLHDTSLLQIGSDADGRRVFAFEGRGRSASDTDRVLRALHDGFGPTRAGATVKTATAEGYVLHTLSSEGGALTTERSDGPWSIIETNAGNDTLVSARDGARFVLTTDAEAFKKRSDSGAPIDHLASAIRWSSDVAARLHPLLPGFAPRGERFTVGLSGGQGYVEWSIRGL